MSLYINVFTNDTFRQFSLPLQFSIEAKRIGAKEKEEEEEKEDRGGKGEEERNRRGQAADDFIFSRAPLSRLFLQKAGAIIVETLLRAIILLRDKGDKLLSTEAIFFDRIKDRFNAILRVTDKRPRRYRRQGN